MKSGIIQTTAAQISSGGTITGDLTVEGDFVVEGGGALTVDAAVTGSVSMAKDGADCDLYITAYHDTEGTEAALHLRKAEGTEASHATPIDSGAVLGTVRFQCYDGNSFVTGAQIVGQASEAWAQDSDAGTELKFSVVNSGTSQTAGVKLLLDGDSRISLSNNDGGDDNTVFGKLARDDLAGGGDDNTFIGYYAGHENQHGSQNIAIGYGSMDTSYDNDTTDAANDNNIFIGTHSGGGAWAADASHTDWAIQSNLGIGTSALAGAMKGTHGNVALGHNAIASITTGDGNVGIGYKVLDSVDGTEEYNVAIGYEAMGAFDENGNAGNGNIAIGRDALKGGAQDDNSIGNIAIGHQTLDGTGTNASEGQIAIGYEALGALTTGANNTAIGYQCLDATDDGASNTAVGYSALSANCGDGNVAMGVQALQTTTGTSNTAIGFQACLSLVAGVSNVAVGNDALRNAGAGESSNIAIGPSAMRLMDEGTSGNVNHNIAIGYQALHGGDINTTSTDVLDNIAIGNAALAATGVNAQTGTIGIGASALAALTTGGSNTAIGYQAGLAMTDNGGNTLIGYEAFKAADSGEGNNVVIGYGAADAINWSTSDDNVIIGKDAGVGGAAEFKQSVVIGHSALNSTGANAQDGQVAIGYQALSAITTGAGNVAVGKNAAADITTGASNTAIGHGAMDGAMESNSEDSDNNTAIGASAMGANWHNTQIDNCVAVGADALGTGALEGASGTVGIGASALAALTSGQRNTAVGYQALLAETAGDYSTAIGYTALISQNGTDGEAGNTAIGAMAGKFVTTGTESTFIGSQAGQGITGTKLTGNLNTCVGETSGFLLQGAANGNTLVGARAADALTTGAGNTIMGQSTVGTLTTGNYNTVIGWGANVDAAADQYQTRLGMNGALRWMTAQVTLNNFDNVTNNDAATAPLLKIPRYGFLKRVTATVVTASGGTGHYQISIATDIVAPGNAPASPIELIGDNGVDGTGATSRSSTLDAASDTNVDLITAKYVHIWECDQATDNAVGWSYMAGQDMYLYICHANGSNASNAQIAVIRVTAEYYGEN